MNNQEKITNSLWATNNSSDVFFFLKDKNENVNENQSMVKSYFDGDNYVLAVYDGQHQANSMLLTVPNFTANEDTLIELNQIFADATAGTSTYHILKVARQATDEVIGMLPTFQAMSGQKQQEMPGAQINVQGFFGQNNLAA